jgi:TonB family protein
MEARHLMSGKMNRAIGYLAVAAMLLSSPAFADEQAIDAAQLRAAGGSLPVMTYAPPSDGKQEFFVRGIQGAVRIRVVIGTDGALQDASIATSSRSPELDTFALGLVRRMTFQPAKNKDGQPVAVISHFPMELWKDSAVDGTLFAKSCADFVLDADWFRQAFPEKQPDQLRGWLLLTGIFIAQRYSSGAKQLTGPDFQTVYEACHAKPKRKLVDIYQQLQP